MHECLYLAIKKAKFPLFLVQPSHCSRVILCIEAGCIRMVHMPSSTSIWVLVIEYPPQNTKKDTKTMTIDDQGPEEIED